MKIINKILVALAAVIFVVGCQGKEQAIVNQVVGEWHYQGTDSDVQEDIWISFGEDMTFELYQKLDGNQFELKKGKWSLDGDILSGIYDDQVPWSTTYKVSVVGNKLTMIAQDGTDETNVYAKTTIPDGVKENCTTTVKSASTETEGWL